MTLKWHWKSNLALKTKSKLKNETLALKQVLLKNKTDIKKLQSHNINIILYTLFDIFCIMIVFFWLSFPITILVFFLCQWFAVSTLLLFQHGEVGLVGRGKEHWSTYSISSRSFAYHCPGHTAGAALRVHGGQGMTTDCMYKYMDIPIDLIFIYSIWEKFVFISAPRLKHRLSGWATHRLEPGYS